jgi:CxxC-x17-CxxC domain-containing protein
MVFSDRNLTCQDCGDTFIFSADDQSYHEQRGFNNEPKRCNNCRQQRRNNFGGGRTGGGGGGERVQHTVTCSECGNEASVPFKPRGDRPVYCSDCFRNQRS